MKTFARWSLTSDGISLYHGNVRHKLTTGHILQYNEKCHYVKPSKIFGQNQNTFWFCSHYIMNNISPEHRFVNEYYMYFGCIRCGLRYGCFTNNALHVIQIRWKLYFALIPLLAIKSQQDFAHATTAQLSWNVQNFVAYTASEFRWEWNKISSNLNCDGKPLVKRARFVSYCVFNVMQHVYSNPRIWRYLFNFLACIIHVYQNLVHPYDKKKTIDFDRYQLDWLLQEIINSSAVAKELRFSCTNPSAYDPSTKLSIYYVWCTYLCIDTIYYHILLFNLF